jgi:hypothetical protein
MSINPMRNKSIARDYLLKMFSDSYSALTNLSYDLRASRLIGKGGQGEGTPKAMR